MRQVGELSQGPRNSGQIGRTVLHSPALCNNADRHRVPSRACGVCFNSRDNAQCDLSLEREALRSAFHQHASRNNDINSMSKRTTITTIWACAWSRPFPLTFFRLLHVEPSPAPCQNEPPQTSIPLQPLEPPFHQRKAKHHQDHLGLCAACKRFACLTVIEIGGCGWLCAFAGLCGGHCLATAQTTATS